MSARQSSFLYPVVSHSSATKLAQEAISEIAVLRGLDMGLDIENLDEQKAKHLEREILSACNAREYTFQKTIGESQGCDDSIPVKRLSLRAGDDNKELAGLGYFESMNKMQEVFAIGTFHASVEENCQQEQYGISDLKVYWGEIPSQPIHATLSSTAWKYTEEMEGYESREAYKVHEDGTIRFLRDFYECSNPLLKVNNKGANVFRGFPSPQEL